MDETLTDVDSIIQLSKDVETSGFNLLAGTTWIYPTNYPIRDYQYNITKAALHQNTLVSLPTGLGKTFIAAVVMYNFYRWYPMGKIIFMAPTKPLVHQQMEACYNIMAIPKSASAEMTGTKQNTSRVKIWQEKRVFFITPHILQNDIDSVLELAPQIRCIVIDEAHKALGKNANCEAIKKIQMVNPNFRVLALSATPGSNFNSIKDVITNLLISHIEVRTNESIDVAPYVFQRKLDKYVIPITGKLLAVKNQYIKILDKYTRPLLQHNIFTGNCANLTKGRIVLTMKEFKEKGRHHNQYGFILKTLNICVTIYHGYELLIRHGLRAFSQFFKDNISKPLINSIGELHAIMDDVEGYLGPIDNVEMLPDGTIPEITGNLVFSHPKFEKLTNILKLHFNEIQDADTRVMVFCEYRESVMEIYTLLLRHRPLIKPRIFLGQGAISQAQQLQAVKMFKSGQCNTLVSTCIGEEGLDVGEVDLIVCFDISSKSPIRMVQRMGRTGRKRDGRVVILVTEGKEEQLLSECLVQRNNMNTLLESKQIKLHLYKNNPKMIPTEIIPECNKMYITASVSEPAKQNKTKKKQPERKNTKTKTNNNNNSTNILKTMFDNISTSQTSSKSSNDGRNTTSVSTASKTSSKKSSSPTKKQADLRSMFTKINNTQISITPTIAEVIIIEDEEEKEPLETSQQLTELISNIKSYLDTSFISAGCEICNNLFDCETIINNNNNNNNTLFNSMKWDNFDSSIFERITADSLRKFTQSLQSNKFEIMNNEKSISDDLEKTFQFFKIDSTCDLFSDSSNDHENSFIVNPVIFNQSSGIFNSSRIYETQNNFASSPTDLFNSSNDENTIDKNVEKVKTPEKILDKDDIIIDESSPEKDKSPALNKSRARKFGIQRRLFSQSSSIHSNISKDFKQLENTNDSIKSQQTFNKEISNNSFNLNSIPKFISTPNKSLSKFSFIPKESTNVMDEKEADKNITSTEPEKNSTTTITNEPEKNLTPDLVHDTKFWDESLFEMYESDDAFETNKNNAEEQKNTTKNVSHDSDETIILSFNSDHIFDNIEKEKEKENEKSILKEPVNTTVNEKTQLENLNKTNNDQSLLSVTQMIEFFNKTQHNKSMKLNELDISNSNSKSKSEVAPQEDIIILDDDDSKEDENNSDKEQSLLCFSQSIKRKIEPTPSQNNKQQPQQQTVLKENNGFVAPPSSSQLNLRNRNKKMKLSTKQNTQKTDVNSVGINVTQDSPLKITRKQLISKKPIILSDSDDDFEVRPKRKEPVVCKVTPEKRFKRIKSVSEINSVLSTKNNTRKTRSQSSSTVTSKTSRTNKKFGACGFLDLEADVSIDEHYESDSEEEENENMLESSFIHDTQSESVLNTTDMQAKYMQSVRSPKRMNPFKMPPLPTDISIFSQVENSEDNTYMVDSFCVDSDTTLTQRHGLSYLEMVEAQLEKRVRKEKKRKRLRIAPEDSD